MTARLASDDEPAKLLEEARAKQHEVDDDRREFICPECANRCTRGRDGTEYGHRRNSSRGTDNGDCPRRPDCVDPGRENGGGSA